MKSESTVNGVSEKDWRAYLKYKASGANMLLGWKIEEATGMSNQKQTAILENWKTLVEQYGIHERGRTSEVAGKTTQGNRRV